MSEPRLPTHEEMTRALERHAAGDFDLSVKLAETQHALDVERARTGVLTEALRATRRRDDGTGQPCWCANPRYALPHIGACGKARAALEGSVLPADRVGVEPLDEQNERRPTQADYDMAADYDR